MARRLPPLNALRAFEAAARHLSFTKAAEELNVTQAAISHQVKLLEEIVGLPLFRRFNRRLALTEAGQAYLPALRTAFDLMATATLRLRERDESGQLKVSTLHSFAAKWLVPRLPRFRERQPDIDVMVSTSYRLIDFGREEVDAAIRLGRGAYPDLETVYLMDDLAFPVCSPQLLRGRGALRKPADLRHHTLLHDVVDLVDGGAPNWRNWLQYAKVTGVYPERGPGYGDLGMAIQAAIAGQGVALGRRALVLDDLKARHLVRPFGPLMPTPLSYYLVSPRATADRPKVRSFRDWLLDEIARDAAEPSWPRLDA